MIFPGFPQMPKMDGPGGFVETVQQILAAFLRMQALLESIDRRLAAIEQGGRWPTLGSRSVVTPADPSEPQMGELP